MTSCKICNNVVLPFGQARVLGKYDVQYFQCPGCGFILTEAPYWLEESYSQSISTSDIGLVSRNLKFARISRVLIAALFNVEAKFLDYGGGYGLFVRLMRDYGFDFYLWDKYTDANLFARGFEVELGGQNANGYELVTAFEVFEHLVTPMEEIERILAFSKNIFFSTLLIPSDPPQLSNWWYYGLEHGQHVSLYTQDSLVEIAEYFNLNLLSNGKTLHLLSEHKISPILFRFILRNKVILLLNWLFKRNSLLARDYYQLTARELT